LIVKFHLFKEICIFFIDFFLLFSGIQAYHNKQYIKVHKKTILSGHKKQTVCAGKSVFLLFYENSTRTSSSFDHAAKILGANSVNLSVKNSSVNKGESLVDTGRTLAAMGADVIVIRHPVSGAPKLLADSVSAAVINAGDGTNEHPTQALLDMLTMREEFGGFKGLRVTIAGDVKHSRVARSNIWGLKTMGAEITVCAPETLKPAGLETFGVRIENDLRKAVGGAHVIMGLRMQSERQQSGLIPSAAEYARYYGISPDVVALADKRAVIMHPGPVNRGVEITSAAIGGAACRIEGQVTNGLAVRMALIGILA
jgi:aspartate carbamoyltransferase catalytic subunit